MSLNLSLNTKDLVRYGVEGAAFIALGTYAFSSMSSACIVYGVGKGTQIGMRALQSAVPNLSADAKSIVTWGVTLLASSAPLYVSMSEATGKSASVFSTVASAFSVGFASACLGVLAEKSYTSSLTTQQSAQKNIANKAPQST